MTWFFSVFANEHVHKLQGLNKSLRFSYFTAQLMVFDGLFARDDLDKLLSYVKEDARVFYDNHLDEDSDNVNWIMAFEIPQFTRLRLWPIIRDAAQFLTGKLLLLLVVKRQ